MGLILQVAARAKGNRHLILLCPAGAAPWPPLSLGEMPDRAKSDRIAVHVIAFSADPELRGLPAATGGSFSVASDVDHCGRLLENLYTTLSRSYHISYRAPAVTGEQSRRDLRIEVYANGGMGAKSWWEDLPSNLPRKADGISPSTTVRHPNGVHN